MPLRVAAAQLQRCSEDGRGVAVVACPHAGPHERVQGLQVVHLDPAAGRVCAVVPVDERTPAAAGWDMDPSGAGRWEVGEDPVGRDPGKVDASIGSRTSAVTQVVCSFASMVGPYW